MLSIGWSEMLIVAAVALIVVGPRDLPAMLRNVGRMVGSLRRMGNEFKAELNKVAAIDEVTDIRKSLTNPIRAATRDIRGEFNKVTSTGVEPSGKLVPDEGDGESVVKKIHEQTGMLGDDAMKAAQKESLQAVVQKAPAPTETTGKASTAKPKPKAKPKRAATKPAAAKPSAAKPAAAKPKATAKAKPKTAAKPAATSTAAKPTAAKPTAAKSTVASKPKAAAKPKTESAASRRAKTAKA